MKKYLLMTLFALSAAGICQATDITPVVNAIKAGNTDMLKNKMDATVDIVTPGASKKGAGTDALLILKAFFQKNKPTGFSVAHHADKSDAGFFVGKLTASTGEFRVNITYAVKEGALLIQIIRIE